MAQARIVGDPEGSIERERLDEWRTYRPDVPHPPLCNAPFGVLHLGADGEARPCAYARVSIGGAGANRLAELWRSEAMEKIRLDLAGGIFRRSVCGRCVSRIEEGLIPQSAPIREYDPVEPAALRDAEAPPAVLVLDLGRGPAPLVSEHLLEDLARWLDALRRLELVAGEGAMTAEGPRRLLSMLREAASAGRATPDLLVRTEGVAGAGEVLEAISGIPRARIRLRLAEAVDLDALRATIRRAREGGAAVEVEFLAGPGNWFDLERVADLCAEAQSRLACRVEDAEGGRPLAALLPDECRFVCMTFAALRERFDPSFAGIAVAEYDRFLEECRAIHRARTEEALARAGSDPPPEGLLRLPPSDHVLLRSEAATLGMLRRLMRIHRSPAVGAWIRSLVSEGSFVERARRRFELRWMAVWGAAVFRDAAAIAALKAVYEDEETRDALLLADAAEAGRQGIQESFGPWTESLGLRRAEVRRPPFSIRPLVRPAEEGRAPDVTVVVPSYMHEDFVEECVRSVLGQSYPYHRTLLVDDGSTDATVERAKGIADERLVVRARGANLGLGPGLAEALEEVRTPFVAILNSDDLFHPERVERCRAALLANPAAGLAATGVVLVDAKGREITPASVSPFFDGAEIAGWVSWYERARREAAAAASPLFPLLRHNYLATSSNLFARTEFLRRHLRVFRDFRYCVDWRLFLEAAAEDGLVVLPDDLLAYRLHGANTVWFRGKERWRFLLEVNRVVARGLRHLFARAGAEGKPVESAVEEILESLVEQVSRNEEADGFALFLEEFLHDAPLEAFAERSPRVRALLDALERQNAERRQAGYLKARLGEAAESLEVWRHEVPYLRLMRNLGEATQEELFVRRGAEAFLRRYKDELERRAGALEGSLEEERRLRTVEASKLRARIVSLEVDAASTIQAKEELLATRDRLEGELETLRADRAALETGLTREKEARASESRGHAEAIDRLRSSKEWRIGNFVWNRLRAGEMSRRGKKWIRHARNRRTRIALAAGRALRAIGGARGRVVVASCWNFPIYSHTFVYQEMQEMRRTGRRVKLFCWETGPRREVHPAFRYLWRNRVLLQADWWIQQRDLAFWRRTRPERVEALLARIAEETGRPTEDLLRDWLVLAGFTFARILQLSGAAYLHTYFFYDQSFMAMMAAFLVGVPRGITAYADHMLKDYPLKCVRLNLDLADVVVATSRRVRDELSAIGDGRFDEKILVKPNGVDVRRFPFVAPEDRARGNGVPEIAAVNRIEPKKGLVYLARAVRLLADRGLPVKVHLVGAPDPHSAGSREYAEELRRVLRELGVEDRVEMHGARLQPEVVSILSRSRVFAAPYVEVSNGDKDGIPTAVLEAMANGVPLVATDAGSIPEVVRDGVEAVCVPQRDPERLADAIERLLRDPELGARLARAARARVEAEYSSDATETRLHERIEGLLARRRGDAPESG